MAYSRRANRASGPAINAVPDMVRVAALILFVLLAACGDDEPTPVPEGVAGSASSVVATTHPESIAAAGEDDEAPAPEPGQQVYEHYCADCHARGPGHPGTMRLALRLDNGVLRTRKDLAPEYVKWVVRNGYQMMPPFRPTEIDDEQLDALSAYVAAATIANQ